jgi:hypothetical protein
MLRLSKEILFFIHRGLIELKAWMSSMHLVSYVIVCTFFHKKSINGTYFNALVIMISSKIS